MRTQGPKLALAISLTTLVLASGAARAATTIQVQGGIRLVAVTSSVSGALLTKARRSSAGAWSAEKRRRLTWARSVSLSDTIAILKSILAAARFAA